MVRVANKTCIRNLSRKSLRASKTRNSIAILAIALTTLMFTALFTIAMSVNEAYQQANFRQVGGYSHGGFKYLTEEQYNELKDDPLIQQYSLRRFLGMPTEIPFNKTHVEISYCDANAAHWMYCDPIEGRLPQEGTNEAATDTRVLELLGVEPKLGAKFTMTFLVDGKETTQTFTLCGWWEKDEVAVADHVLIPESRVNAVLNEVGVTPPCDDVMTGTWNLDVMFSNSRHIEENMQTILQNHGYQSESRSAGDNYISIGVNWGYTGAQLASSMDLATLLMMVFVLLIIVITGYLIIYNIFQISVVGDIRFYGLLKTIGTTGRQIKKIIRQQALILSVVGIPVGLVLGWGTGSLLTPVVLSQLDGVVMGVVSVSPLIFVVATLFALLTVFLSCSRPGRMAAKISPVEAVRYTEGSGSRRTVKQGTKGISLFGMARANLGRSRGKTAVTLLSLALAVVLLDVTVLFAGGFDMDKYLADRSVCDFIFADAGYFQVGTMELFTGDQSVEEDVISDIDAQDGITGAGKIYGLSTDFIKEFVTEDYYRAMHRQWFSEEELDEAISWEETDDNGNVSDDVQLYGMDSFALSKMKVLEGDISEVQKPGSRKIAAVYLEDDYGEPIEDSQWAKLGDTVTLRYIDEVEYYNPVTGEVYEDPDSIGEDDPYDWRALRTHDVDYEVAALVSVPMTLSYRYYGRDEFILNDQTFVKDTGTSDVMIYCLDTTEEARPKMEQYMKEYTENINPNYDYESKADYQAEFEGFRNMFLLMGFVLSFVIGLVGILNFINAILTGIITRKHEFAMLQSIGMTGKQLKTMLVEEGVLYALGSIVLALILSLILQPIAGMALSRAFWFFSYHLTLAPVLVVAPIFVLLGCVVPLVLYRTVAKQTIVERLRESEN
ncbi:MAG: ABC transporter permease [Eubacteriales bacterium]|nr:ABC transporter permease [Eubacteriales bacterium]